MLVTEEEASKKWCPQASGQQDNCVGSNCMMWRVYDSQYRDGELNNDRRGYCGLAGEVEYTITGKKA